MPKKTNYLIVGNSAAGISAAEAIRAHDDTSTITMVSMEPYPAYGRPLISYLIEGKTDEDKIWLKDADFYEKHAIDTYFGEEFEAVKLDADAHEVHLANDEVIGYDKCLLATGSVPFTPPIKGLEGKQNVYTFMTLDDAKDAWAAACAVNACAHEEGRTSRVIVIGAGLIGLKAAEALSHYVDEVLVLELAPRILPAVLDDEGAALLEAMLLEHGIVCMPGVSAEELTGTDELIDGAVLTNGESVCCDMVIAAVGVRPNSSLAVDAGAASGRGLICDETLMTSLQDVYAAGDLVQVTDILDGSERPLALWLNAIRLGESAGKHMVGDPDAEPFVGGYPVNAVDFFDASLLTAGIINPDPDSSCEVEIRTEGNSYAKFVTRDGVLVGYILLNRPMNAGIYTGLIEEAIPLDQMDATLFDEPLNLDYPTEKRWDHLHRFYPSDLDKLGWKERA